MRYLRKITELNQVEQWRNGTNPHATAAIRVRPAGCGALGT
jgi:hypothetical protein